MPSHVLTMPTERQVRTERIFDAPPQRVWDAVTRPELLARWWGRGNPVDVVRMDVEPGGHWRYVEHASDGDHGFEGRYREVSPPQRLAQTFEWDGAPGHVSVTTTTFEELDPQRTRVVTFSQFMTAEERDQMMSAGMEEGLAASFAALDALLASSDQTWRPAPRANAWAA